MHLVTLACVHILYMRYNFNIQREFIQHMMRVIRNVWIDGDGCNHIMHNIIVK